MIWFVLGFALAYAVIAALIAYEFEEFLLDLSQPEQKSKPWKGL